MTDKDAEGCPYCQCSSLVFVPIDANYGERRCASCSAVHSVMQIEDHAELARLRAALAEAERERDEARGKLERRRIEADDTRVNAARWEETALTFKRERDEARGKKIAKLAPHYSEEWDQMTDDERFRAFVSAEADAEGYRYYFEDELSKKDTTIRALVVAARAMWWAIHQMASEEQRAYFRVLAKTEAIFMRRFGVTSDREAGDAVMKIWNERAERVNAREADNG